MKAHISLKDAKRITGENMKVIRNIQTICKVKPLAAIALVTVMVACSGGPPQSRNNVKTSDASAEGMDAHSRKLAAESPSISGDVKSQIKQYQGLIAERNAELNFLRNSEDKLSKMILLQSARGCMLSQNIDSLEIRIGGSRQPDREAGKRSNKKSSEGNPDDIVVDFGNGMTVSMNGNGFFDNRKHTTGSLSSRKVADISRIKFEKDGIKYSNDRRCKKSGGFLGIGASEKCEYEYTEENIWFLSEVKISVNGVLIYDQGGIDKTFDGRRAEWKDDNMKNNRAYIEMLSKVSCD